MKILLSIILVFLLASLLKAYKAIEKKEIKEVFSLIHLEKEMNNNLIVNPIINLQSQKTIKINSDFEINHPFSKLQLVIINVFTVIAIFLFLIFKIKFID